VIEYERRAHLPGRDVDRFQREFAEFIARHPELRDAGRAAQLAAWLADAADTMQRQ
jgi:hypothetical protein